MAILEFKSIELDFCFSCRGCWLDKGELGLILTGSMDVPDDWNIEGERKSDRRCPRCTTKMKTGILPGTGVEVDVCPKHHGIWFDEGELVQVARTKGRDDHAGVIAGFVTDIFGEEDTEQERRQS